MAKPKLIDVWGAGARLAELWAIAVRGKAMIDEIRPYAERWSERTGNPLPEDSAIYMACRRYMMNDPVDLRTKQARAQGAVVEIAEQAAVEMVKGQLDAFANIQKLADRLHQEIDDLAKLKEPHPLIPGEFVVPSLATYAGALVGYSKEMRGWTSLFVEIRDRLAQHEEYERAYQTILGAVRTTCTPEQNQAIAGRLRADHAVAAVLRGTGGGGADGLHH